MIEKIYGRVKDVTHLQTRYEDLPIYGFDTETPAYTIRLLSISDGETSHLYDVTAETILDVFLAHFAKVRKKRLMLFAHNLAFDFLVVLNQDLHDPDNMQFLQQHCAWEYDGCRIEYFNDTPHFGKITYPDGKVIEIRDTFSFFGHVKLSKLAKILEIGTKLQIDKEEFYSESSHLSMSFREYSKEDARLAARIGEKIMEFHAMDDIRPCVSAPQMAMSIFRKNYLRKNEVLSCPDYNDLQPWELSYHGGKNGCYHPSPSEHENVYLYDIKSAYPYAMTQIPSFINARFHKREAPKFKRDQVGIYCVTLKSRCAYNSTFDHDFAPLKHLEKIWITSYELASLMDHDCIISLKIHKGIFVEERCDRNPLAEYARYYYDLKNNTPKGTALYFWYKVGTLNSLYGKFIERRYEDENDYSLRGPNYNPAIASLITGHARAYLHAMEHQGDALHSATDSVFTKRTMETGHSLGDLECEGFGRLQMYRTKCYMFWTAELPKGDAPIYTDRGLYLTKYATHAFHGTVDEFIRLWNNRGEPKRGAKFRGERLDHNEYLYRKMPTAGEYLLHSKLKLKLFGMNEMKATLNVDWSLYNEQ